MTRWCEAVWQRGFSFGLQNVFIAVVNSFCNSTTNRTSSWQFVQWVIKVDRLYITAMVTYYSKQCYLREINVFILRSQLPRIHRKTVHFTNSRIPLSCLDLCARAALPKPPSLPGAQPSSIHVCLELSNWVVCRNSGFFQTQECI